MRLMQMRFFDVQGPTYFQRYLVLAMHGHDLIVLALAKQSSCKSF